MFDVVTNYTSIFKGGPFKNEMHHIIVKIVQEVPIFYYQRQEYSVFIVRELKCPSNGLVPCCHNFLDEIRV